MREYLRRSFWFCWDEFLHEFILSCEVRSIGEEKNQEGGENEFEEQILRRELGAVELDDWVEDEEEVGDGDGEEFESDDSMVGQQQGKVEEQAWERVEGGDAFSAHSGGELGLPERRGGEQVASEHGQSGVGLEPRVQGSHDHDRRADRQPSRGEGEGRRRLANKEWGLATEFTN